MVGARSYNCDRDDIEDKPEKMDFRKYWKC